MEEKVGFEVEHGQSWSFTLVSARGVKR